MAISSTSRRWGGLRLEPYDPQARDADGDGIIQEGTAWERPAGTTLLDSAGNAIPAGTNSATRFAGLRIMDGEGREVQYTPSYEGAGAGAAGTALGEHGALSIGERGLPTVRDYVTPPETPQPAAVLPSAETESENAEADNLEALVEEMLEARAPEDGPSVSRIDAEVPNRDQLPYIVGLRGSAKPEDGPRPAEEVEGSTARRRWQRYVDQDELARSIEERIRSHFRNFPDRDAERKIDLWLDEPETKRIVSLAIQDTLDAYEDKDLLVAAQSATAIEILKSGRFKTQHETGTTGGLLNPEVRVFFEERTLGVPKDIDVRRRPIYGWIRKQSRRDGLEAEQASALSSFYGPINFRLKKELKGRTTVTFGDSLGEDRIGVPLLSKDRKKLSSAWYKAEAAKSAIVAALRTEDEYHASWIIDAIGGYEFPDQVRSRVTARAIQEHPELASVLGEPEDFSGSELGQYIETQIHGGVDVRDIEEIEVPSEVPDEVRKEIERLAEPYGIKVGYRAELDWRKAQQGGEREKTEAESTPKVAVVPPSQSERRATKGLAEALEVKAPIGPRRKLREEPYDPEAKDGDGDGIVQEGTAWERPAGTRILDATGKEIARGQISGNRSRSHRIVDADNNEVEYTPTYERSEIGTIGRSVGMIRGADSEPEATVEPAVEATRPSKFPDYLNRTVTGIDRLRRDGRFNSATNYIKDVVNEVAKWAGIERLLQALGIEESPENLPEWWIRENWLHPSVIPDDLLDAYVDETELFMDELVERGVHIAVPQFALFGEEVRADRGGSFRTPGILADERVKSQFETGTSQGYLDPSFRSDFEAEYMGVPQDIEETQRPIYGFIPNQIDRGTGEINLHRDPAALYSGGWPNGRGVILRLKPGVEDRTTVTFNDSLDSQLYPIPLSKQLRESHAQQLQESIDARLEDIGLPLTGEQNLLMGAEDDALSSTVGPRLADRFIEQALNGSDSLTDAWFPGRSERNSATYIEAQIHGGVDLADVEEIILPESMSMYERQPNGAVLRTDLDIRDFLASDVPDAKLLMEKALKHGITITYIHPETKKIETWYAPPSKAQPAPTRQAGSFTGSIPDAVPDVGPVLTDAPIGVNADSGDRDELPEPVKPRAPYTPAPPPFSGKAADIVQMARLDFERVLELLDEEGYWLLDFETTGFDHGNMPTQVAMVRVEKGQVVQRINQFINPDRPLSDWSRQHLRDGDGQPLTEEWLAENGISVDEAQRRLSALLDGQIVVAHNAPFDLEVLQRIVDQNNGVLNLGGSVDTLALMRMAVPKGDGDETGPKSHALGSLAEYLGYTLGEDAHDALADVDATNEVLRRGLVSAATNPRAELGVLDNLYMKRLYSRQQEQYEVDLAKHRDAMREYNRQVFEYRRALSGGKNASVPDIRVPYTPGPASSQTILDKAQKQRLAVRSALRNRLIEILASLGDGGDGREEWVRLHQTLAVESESRSTGLSTDPEELAETARKMAQSERIEFLEKNFGSIFDRDQEFIDEVIDEALALHVDSELTKQVYVPATEIVAAQILRDGRIMTQFEQPVEGLDGSLRERASVETELLGVPRGTSDKNRPVYGYMPRTTDAEFGSTGTSDPDPTRDPSTIHGSIAIRLKDDIRDRTTATFGDSMTGSVGIAIPVTERAREELLRSYPDPEVGSRTDVRNSLLQAAVSDEFVEGVASVASGAWIDRLPDEMRRAVNARMRRSGMIAGLTPQKPHYIEAQVHGGVSLDDIAELVLPNEVGSFSDAMRAVLTLARWRNIRIRTADGRVPLETDTGWRFVRPDENKSNSGANSQSPYVEVKAASRRITLIDEPYDPDAKDGDGDGIVQEWTVWERPAGTVLMLDGKPVVRGQRIKSTSLTARPAGLTVVDKDGNVVDYKPTYQPRLEEGSIGAEVGRLTPTGGASTPQPEAAAPESQKPKKRGTPLSDVGGQSIQERGAGSVRQFARPAAPPQTSAQPGVAPQPDPDARKLPVLPARDRIGELYTPGQGDVYNRQGPLFDEDRDSLEWEFEEYLLVDYEELYDSYLSRMIEKILDDFDLSNPTEVERFLEYIRPIAPNIDAIRELLKRSFDPLRERGVTSKYSFEDAALPILQQLFKENFESDISDALIEAHVDDLEVRTKGAPRVAILQNALIKALQDGRILSQFESGTSQGTYDPTYRKNLERRALGIPDIMVAQYRPIYGFFPDLNRLFGWTEDGEFVVSYGKRKNAELPPLENSSVTPYGQIQVVLKEGLRERTTVSVGDSFGVRKATAPLSEKALEEIGRKVGYERPDGTVDIDRVRRLTSVFSRKQYGNFSLMALALNGLFNRQNPEKRKFLLDALKKSGYMKVDEIEEVPFGYEYTEAQIHGGVDIQDIDKVILPYANAETAPSALIALLDLRGIPYEFQFG